MPTIDMPVHTVFEIWSGQPQLQHYVARLVGNLHIMCGTWLSLRVSCVGSPSILCRQKLSSCVGSQSIYLVPTEIGHAIASLLAPVNILDGLCLGERERERESN